MFYFHIDSDFRDDNKPVSVIISTPLPVMSHPAQEVTI